MGVPNTGLAQLAALTGDVSSPDAFAYLALGSDSTAFAATQEAPISEITGNGLARAAATVTRTTTTVTNDTTRFVHEWTASGTETVRESCVMTASSGGAMGSRKVIDPAKSLTSGDTIEVTQDIIFSTS